jgi:hypothetical protein
VRILYFQGVLPTQGRWKPPLKNNGVSFRWQALLGEQCDDFQGLAAGEQSRRSDACSNASVQRVADAYRLAPIGIEFRWRACIHELSWLSVVARYWR